MTHKISANDFEPEIPGPKVKIFNPGEIFIYKYFNISLLVRESLVLNSTVRFFGQTICCEMDRDGYFLSHQIFQARSFWTKNFCQFVKWFIYGDFTSWFVGFTVGDGMTFGCNDSYIGFMCGPLHLRSGPYCTGQWIDDVIFVLND